MEQNDTRLQSTEEAETEEQSSVFRRKSIDRISSPEQLNDYIRVASPRIWTVLAAVIILLVGFCVWGIFGSIESSVYCAAIIEDGNCTLYLPQAKVSSVQVGDPVTIENETTTLISIETEPMAVTESFSEYARSLGDLSVGEWVYEVHVGSLSCGDGVYYAKIVEETISPISFLTDKN